MKFANEWISVLARPVLLFKEINILLPTQSCFFLDEFILKLPTVYFSVESISSGQVKNPILPMAVGMASHHSKFCLRYFLPSQKRKKELE